MLAAAVEDAGGVAELLRFVPDDVAHLHRVLDERLAAGTVDLVLTSGGISAGAYEVVKEGLAGRGVEFVKVAMQPGGPQGVGRVGGVGVVALPGNPVSSHVSFEVFVRPLLRAALGHPHPERPRVTAALAAPLTSTAGPASVPPGGARRRRGHRPGGRRAAVAPARERWPGPTASSSCPRRSRSSRPARPSRCGCSRGDVTGLTSRFCNDLGCGERLTVCVRPIGHIAGFLCR